MGFFGGAKKVVKKVVKAPVVEPTPVPVPTPAPVVAAPVADEPEVSLVEKLCGDLIEQSKTISQLHSKMNSALRKLLKTYQKDCKSLRRKTLRGGGRKKDPNRARRAPSGFAKPTQITDALCDFLGIPHGQLVARTDVTKKVTSYIREHSLQVEADKKQFIPDKKLQSILAPLNPKFVDKNGKTDVEKGYTYFNLQRYLSKQFPKKVVA